MHTASAEEAGRQRLRKRLRASRRREPVFTVKGLVYAILAAAFWFALCYVAEAGGNAVDRWLP